MVGSCPRYFRCNPIIPVFPLIKSSVVCVVVMLSIMICVMKDDMM